MPRDDTGIFTLAQPPVVASTIIRSSNENFTRADFASGLTDSLSRTGKGAMLNPLKHATGSAANPSVTFSADGGVGFWLPAAGTLEAVAGVTQLQRWTTSLVTVYPAVELENGLSVQGALNATDDSTFGGNVHASSLNVTGPATVNSLSTIQGAAVGASLAVFADMKAGGSVTGTSGNASLRAANRSSTAANGAFVAFYNNDSTTYPTDPGTRWAYVGFPGADSTFTIRNEFVNGHVYVTGGNYGNMDLVTWNGYFQVKVNGNHPMVFDNSAGGQLKLLGANGSNITFDVNGNISIAAGSGSAVTIAPRLRSSSTSFSSGAGYTATTSPAPTAFQSLDSGYVLLAGGFTAGSSATTALATLPSTYAPVATMHVAMLGAGAGAGGGDVVVSATVNTSGAVVLTSAPVVGATYYLDGITFAAS